MYNGNVVAHTCTDYTSLANVTALYHFTQTERFYGGLMSSITIKHTQVYE